MPKIPTYIRQVNPAGKGGSVFADPSAFGKEFAVLAQGGKEAREIGLEFAKKFKDAKTISEFYSARNKFNKLLNQRYLEAGDDSEYWNIPETYEKRIGEDFRAVASEIKDSDAQNLFNGWAEKKKIDSDYAIAKISRTKWREKMEGDLPSIRESFIQARDIKGLNIMLDTYQEAGIINAKTAEDYKRRDEYTIKRSVVWEQAVLRAQTEGMDEAEKYLYSPEVKEALAFKDIKQMASNLDTEMKLIEARYKKAEEERIEEIEDNIADALIAKDYAGALRLAGNRELKGKRRIALINTINTQAEKMAKGEKGPFEVTDPKLEADFIRKIDLNPEEVKKADYYQYHGNGLSTNSIKKISNLHKSRMPKEIDVDAKNILKAFDSFYNSGGLGDKDEPDTNLKYAEMRPHLEKYLKDNKEADSKVKLAYYEQLIKPHKESWYGDIVRGFAHAVTFGFKKQKTEEEIELPLGKRIVEAGSKTYTKEQEKLIKENMDFYKKSREEVIEALKKKGLL